MKEIGYLKNIGSSWSSRKFETHGSATDQPQEKNKYKFMGTRYTLLYLDTEL